MDLTDAKVKDGKIKGLDEQLAEVAKANPYLFGEASAPKGVAPGNPGGKAPSGAVTKKTSFKMTLLSTGGVIRKTTLIFTIH